MKRSREVLALASLFALVALPTARTIASGPALCVAGPSDELARFMPAEQKLRDEVRRGTVPLWNPRQLYGIEMLGDPPEHLLYPPALLHALVDFPLSHHLFLLAHAFLLGAGTYALARGERCSRLAAFLAGAMLGLSFKWFLYILAGWDSVSCAFAWVPLALVFFRQAMRTRNDTPAVLMGVVLALSCLAGIPMFLGYLALGLPLVSLLPGRRRPGRLARVLVISCAVAFALASPQLLCALEMSARTARAQVETTYGTVLPRDVLGALAFPDFTREDYSWEFSNVLGVAGLPLACAGIARRRGRIPFGAWLAIVFLLFSAGPVTPFGLVAGRLPVIRSLSYVSRLLWLVALGEAVLAAEGLDALLRLDRGRRRRRVLVGLAAGALLVLLGALVPGRLERMLPSNVSKGLVVGALVLELLLLVPILLLPLVPRRLRRGALVGLAAFTALELLALGELALPRVPMTELERPSPIEEALAREPAARFAVVSSQSIWHDPIVPFYAARGIDRACGYNPLHDRAVEQFLHAIGEERLIGSWAPYLWLEGIERPDLLAVGVTHIVTRAPIPGFDVVSEEVRRVYSGSGVWIEKPAFLARVPGALPRAYLMPRATAVAAEDQLATMRGSRFDGRRQLIVTGVVPVEGTNEEPLPVEIVEREANRVRLRARAPVGGGWVVLLDAWSPSWRAEVDGVAAPLERANALFRAVHVPGGDHVVSMSIRLPSRFWAGCVFAVGALLACGVLRSRSRGRTRDAEPGRD